MTFAAKGKKNSIQNQDKQRPHTVLQKLSPKPTPSHLITTDQVFMKILPEMHQGPRKSPLHF